MVNSQLAPIQKVTSKPHPTNHHLILASLSEKPGKLCSPSPLPQTPYDVHILTNTGQYLLMMRLAQRFMGL